MKRLTKAELAAVVGKHLAHLRDVSGLSRPKVAARTSIKSRTIEAYETGEYMPTLYQLIRLLEFYNSDLETFAEWISRPTV